jgi:hypothetical protein
MLNDFFYICDERPNTLMNLLRPAPTAERQYRLHGDACFFTLFHCLECAYKVVRQFMGVFLFRLLSDRLTARSACAWRLSPIRGII